MAYLKYKLLPSKLTENDSYKSELFCHFLISYVPLYANLTNYDIFILSIFNPPH